MISHVAISVVHSRKTAWDMAAETNGRKERSRESKQELVELTRTATRQTAKPIKAITIIGRIEDTRLL